MNTRRQDCRYCQRAGQACGRQHTLTTRPDWSRDWSGDIPANRTDENTSTEKELIMTVQPLPASNMGPLRAKLNKGLMVHWINADLLSRAGHDVRKSIVFYDDAQTFETALTQADWDALGDKREAFLQRLYAATPVRFWSKGVK